MPKDEIDPEDPLELCGVALLTEEDTSDAMTECFIEEFMRLGFNPGQVLALFRNRHYTGPNMVLQNRGEPYVQAKIVEVFGWWGQAVTPAPGASGGDPAGNAPPSEASPAAPPPQVVELDPALTEPGGAAIPRL